MIAVVVSLALLFAIALVKKIPWIGGNIQIALLVSGLAAALISGIRPIDYVTGTIDGVDRLAWVIALSVFGSVYAETQSRLGTIDTTLTFLRRIFGNSPKGLITATFLTLVFAGSLLGDAIAAATVIGFLVIHSLAEMKIKPTQIGMIILLGASLGSIMPPITQAIFLSASIVGIDPGPVVRIAFVTVGVGVVLAIVESFRFVRGRKGLPASVEPAPPLRVTLTQRGHTLIPLAVLVVIVLLNTAWEIDVFSLVPGVSQVVAWMNEVPILKGIAFPIVLAIILATLVTFAFPSVRRAPGKTVVGGLKKVNKTVQIQLCAAFMIGMFYASGTVDVVAGLAEGLTGPSVAIVGTVAIIAVGMLTGSQTTAQTVIVPFLAPILEQTGVDPVNIALGVSHIASAGQNMPPVGLTAFVVCGLIGGTLNVKVDPVKVMLLSLPNSIYLAAVGLVALLIGTV